MDSGLKDSNKHPGAFQTRPETVTGSLSLHFIRIGNHKATQILEKKKISFILTYTFWFPAQGAKQGEPELNLLGDTNEMSHQRLGFPTSPVWVQPQSWAVEWKRS